MVSVPALVLLCLWFAENVSTMLKIYHIVMDMALNQLSSMDADVSADQIQVLLSGATGQAASQGAWGWRLLGAVSGAFAWWYTLAVCYAEYRDLRSRAEARTH